MSNATRPVFSIITVVWNDAKGLQATFESLQQQSYPAIQHIVIDGASTDDTVAVIEANAESVAYWHSESDRGLYDAMNKGLDQATGAFVVFLNAGDILLEPTGLQTVADQIQDPDTAYFTQARLVSPVNSISRLVPPNQVDLEAWLKDRTPNHQSVFFPRCFYEGNRYDLSFTVNSDGDYMLRCFGAFGLKYIHLLNVEFELGGLSNAYTNFSVVKRWIHDRQRLYASYYPNKRFKFFKSTLRPLLIFASKRILGSAYLPAMRRLRRYE